MRSLARIGQPRLHHAPGDLRRVLVVDPRHLGELVQVERVVLLLHLHVEEEIVDQLIGAQHPATPLRHDQARLLEGLAHPRRLFTSLLRDFR